MVAAEAKEGFSLPLWRNALLSHAAKLADHAPCAPSSSSTSGGGGGGGGGRAELSFLRLLLAQLSVLAEAAAPSATCCGNAGKRCGQGRGGTQGGPAGRNTQVGGGWQERAVFALRSALGNSTLAQNVGRIVLAQGGGAQPAMLRGALMLVHQCLQADR